MRQMSGLNDRQAYVILSRNLRVGVWVASERAFIGLRRKFDDVYPDSEYHREVPGGTAAALAELPISMPAEVPTAVGWFVCVECRCPMSWDTEARRYAHDVPTECAGDDAQYYRPPELGAFLKKLERDCEVSWRR